MRDTSAIRWVFAGAALAIAGILLMDGYRSSGVFANLLDGAKIDLGSMYLEARVPVLAGAAMVLWGFYREAMARR